MYEYAENVISTMKVKVDKNRDGNIAEEGDIVAGSKKISFGGFASSITADEAINTENSPALHNGVAGLMWLLSGTDENFNTNVTRTLTEEIDDV